MSFIIINLEALNEHGDPLQLGYDSQQTAVSKIVAFNSILEKYEARDFSSARMFEPSEGDSFENWDVTDELRTAIRQRVKELNEQPATQES